VQLDRTQIVVSERSMPEILDLALQSLRAYARPLLLLFVLGAAPLALVNHLLIGWIADVNYGDFSGDTVGQICRYLWNMTLLVYLEAPLATTLVTAYLGQAVFLEQPRFRALLADVMKLSPRLLLCQGVLRGVLPAWLLMAFIDRNAEFTVVEGLFVPGIAAYALLIRALRPYMNEIILLERNPLRSRAVGAMTIGRRSSLLHNPGASGDLILRYMGAALTAVLLVLMVFGALWCVPGLLLEDWAFSYWLVVGVFPLSLWIVAGYFAVVRYLAYLDLRIRQEGWEVELKLRAEAARLASKLT
jgi:hypothetical protein